MFCRIMMPHSGWHALARHAQAGTGTEPEPRPEAAPTRSLGEPDVSQSLSALLSFKFTGRGRQAGPGAAVTVTWPPRGTQPERPPQAGGLRLGTSCQSLSGVIIMIPGLAGEVRVLKPTTTSTPKFRACGD